MIKLTEAQRQTATALAELTRDRPLEPYFTAEVVRDTRLRDTGKECNKAYLRTTQNALWQLNNLVPTIATGSAAGWKLTDVGRVMARSQLGVEI